MKITGERHLSAPRNAVWAALNDPLVLQFCIPGCETVERTAAHQLAIAVRIKIWPLSALFHGKVDLVNVEAPERYTLLGEGTGGIAGLAKGEADVRLEARDTETILYYDIKAQAGGTLSKLGTRFIGLAAQRLVDGFFSDLESAARQIAETGIFVPVKEG